MKNTQQEIKLKARWIYVHASESVYVPNLSHSVYDISTRKPFRNLATWKDY